MASEIIASTVLISLALAFYTTGVWSERLSGRLKAWPLIYFWGGLVFDTAGTGLMFEMVGRVGTDIPSLTGVIAILFMLVHAIWATVVLIRKDEKSIMCLEVI